jgi:hypothetical protein
MKKALRNIVCLLVGALWLGVALPLSAATIFDNSALGSDLHLRFNPGTYEVGDEIILAGTERYLTYFDFEYWGVNTADPYSFAGNVEARVRFYENTGDPYNTYPTPSPLPFYDSGWFSVASPTARSTFIFTAGSDGIPLGGLFIPADDITWSVQFQGMGTTDSVGVDLYSPPVVGEEKGDFGDYWQYNGGWMLLTNSIGPMDFGATMQATPEPSSFALSLLGGVGLLIAMRRFRRNE